MNSLPPRLQKQKFTPETVTDFIQESFDDAFNHSRVKAFAEQLKELNLPPDASSGYGVNISNKRIDQFKWYQELKTIPDPKILATICPHSAAFLEYAKYYDKSITASLCLGIKLRRKSTDIFHAVSYSHIKFSPEYKFESPLLRFLMPKYIKLLPFDRNGISFETEKKTTKMLSYFYYHPARTSLAKMQKEFSITKTEAALFDHVEYTEGPEGPEGPKEDRVNKFIIVYDHFENDKRTHLEELIATRAVDCPLVRPIIEYVKSRYSNTPCFYGQYKSNSCFSIYWSQAHQLLKVL